MTNRAQIVDNQRCGVFVGFIEFNNDILKVILLQPDSFEPWTGEVQQLFDLPGFELRAFVIRQAVRSEVMPRLRQMPFQLTCFVDARQLLALVQWPVRLRRFQHCEPYARTQRVVAARAANVLQHEGPFELLLQQSNCVVSIHLR